MEEKRCSTCKSDKPIGEFVWINKEKGKLSLSCKPCRKEIAKRSYEKNKLKVITDVQQKRKDLGSWLQELKDRLKCELCNEDENICLDFHHLDPLEKEYTISQMLNRGSKNKVLKEIKKCICVCSNCHRKIHKYGLENTKALMNSGGSTVF
jgi:hypothetical protein